VLAFFVATTPSLVLRPRRDVVVVVTAFTTLSPLPLSLRLRRCSAVSRTHCCCRRGGGSCCRRGCRRLLPDPRRIINNNDNEVMDVLRKTSTTISTSRFTSSSGSASYNDNDNDNLHDESGDEEDDGATDTDGEYDDSSSWESASAATVYDDLNRLERAIALSQSRDQLRFAERNEMLEYFAAQRRPLYSDLARYVVPIPLLAIASAAITAKFRTLRTLATAVSDFHFWSAVVVAPILFLAALNVSANNKKKQKQKSPTAPLDLDPEYARLAFGGSRNSNSAAGVFYDDDDEDDNINPLASTTSCRNYVQCLLEQWVSAVSGFALVVGVPSLLMQLGSATRMTTKVAGNANYRAYIRLAQFLTRAAAYVALKQFPKLWFQLTRRGQPQPLTKQVWGLQTLAACQFYPWCLVPDLANVAFALCENGQWEAMGYASLALASAAAFICLRPEVLSFNNNSEQRHQQNINKPRLIPRRIKVLLLIAGIGCAAREIPTAVVGVSKTFMEAAEAGTLLQLIGSGSPVLLRQLRSRMLVPAAIAVASIGPLAHLVVFRKLLRVYKTHDLSLSNPDTFARMIQNRAPSSLKERIKWRWRLHWREPQRVRVVLQQQYDQFWYWLFFSGSVQDKLRREFDPRSRRAGGGEAHRQGLSVLQQIAREREDNGYSLTTDRSQWKQRAMDRLAARHKEQYERRDFQVSIASTRSSYVT